MALKLRRAKTHARGKHVDHTLRYPDEVREAQQKQYTKLTKRVTEECQSYFDMVDKRRLKSIGK